MIKIISFIIIGGLIFSSLMYTKSIELLADIVIKINDNFFPYLIGEMKAIFLLIVVIIAYRLYRNYTT